LRLTLLLFFALTTATYAQKTYRGLVVDSVTMAALPNVHVSVKNSTAGTYTNTAGSFTLRCHAVDTLVFSSLGYASVEVPMLFEEDALFIRLREQIKMLQEITVKASRLFPNQIADRTHSAPRKMATYQAFESPFTYFSKTEKEKRKIYRFVEEGNKTQTYVQVITDPDVKKIFMEDYELTDEGYYELLAKFNQAYRGMQYATNPDDIMEALHSYFSAAK
jgi:hypothetical protein